MIKSYEEAIEVLGKHLILNSDGTLSLDHDGSDIDLVIFADLTRSLDIANRLILRGEIKSEDVKI